MSGPFKLFSIDDLPSTERRDMGDTIRPHMEKRVKPHIGEWSEFRQVPGP